MHFKLPTCNWHLIRRARSRWQYQAPRVAQLPRRPLSRLLQQRHALQLHSKFMCLPRHAAVSCAGVCPIGRTACAQPVALLCCTACASAGGWSPLALGSSCPQAPGSSSPQAPGSSGPGGRHCSLKRQCRLTLSPCHPHLARACVRVFVHACG